MKCSKCGKNIDNGYVSINGVYYCHRCARELRAGIPGAESFFTEPMKFFDNEFSNLISPFMGDLDFSPTRSQIKCPRCGTTLRDLESGSTLGCIECYNTFNESIMRMVMRTQANTSYKGRKPGEASSFVKDFSIAEYDLGDKGDDADKNIDATGTAGSQTAKPNRETETAESLNKKELTDMTNEELQTAMEQAIKIEDYAVAAKIRDEINGRKEN